MKSLVKNFIHSLGYDIKRYHKDQKGISVEYSWLLHFLYFSRLYDAIAHLKGNLVECGVGNGHTLYKLASLLQKEDADRMLWGFDSFKGFPEPSIHDQSQRNPKKGEWNVATPKGIYAFLNAGGIQDSVLEKKIKLVPGFFQESLSCYDNTPVAFLHLDVDLYESYKVTLEKFWPLMVKGGVVLFDEYKQQSVLSAFPGASKAIDQYLGTLSKNIQYDTKVGRFFIVKD